MRLSETILTIDAGNSNVVLASVAFEKASDAANAKPRPKIQRTWRIPTHPIGTDQALRARISEALRADGMELSQFHAVVLASVVPELTAIAREALPEIRVIDSSWPFSFHIGTRTPERTGIDRLVNAEALCRESPDQLPAIIVDAGTATTICALVPATVKDGEMPTFLGGAILPGIEGCRDSLAGRAAQLFSVQLKAPESVIGDDTDSALRSGVVLGYASMIDGMVARFRAEISAKGYTKLNPIRVVATGGVSRLLQEICTELDELDPDLTLRGIAYLYESLRNQST